MGEDPRVILRRVQSVGAQRQVDSFRPGKKPFDHFQFLPGEAPERVNRDNFILIEFPFPENIRQNGQRVRVVKITSAHQGVVGVEDERNILRLLFQQAIRHAVGNGQNLAGVDGSLFKLRREREHLRNHRGALPVTGINLELLRDAVERETHQDSPAGIVDMLAGHPAGGFEHAFGKAAETCHIDFESVRRAEPFEHGAFREKRILFGHDERQVRLTLFNHAFKKAVNPGGFAAAGSAENQMKHAGAPFRDAGISFITIRIIS